MTTIIGRPSRTYRPYGFNGRYVGSITIYKAGVVLFRSRQGWLENSDPEFYGRRDVEQLVLSHEPRRANKLNLGKGGHFFIVGGKDLLGERAYDLYLDAATGDVIVGDEFEMRLYGDTQGETWTKARKLTLRQEDGSLNEIIVQYGGSIRKANAFGDAMAKLTEALQAKGLEQRVSGLVELAKDPALLTLLNEAAAVYAAAQKKEVA